MGNRLPRFWLAFEFARRFAVQLTSREAERMGQNFNIEREGDMAYAFHS